MRYVITCAASLIISWLLAWWRGDCGHNTNSIIDESGWLLENLATAKALITATAANTNTTGGSKLHRRRRPPAIEHSCPSINATKSLVPSSGTPDARHEEDLGEPVSPSSEQQPLSSSLRECTTTQDDERVAPTRGEQLGAARTDDLEDDNNIGIDRPLCDSEQCADDHIMSRSLHCEHTHHDALPALLEDVTTVDDTIVVADDKLRENISGESDRTRSAPDAPDNKFLPRRIWRAPSEARPKLGTPVPEAAVTSHSHGSGIAPAKTDTHEHEGTHSLTREAFAFWAKHEASISVKAHNGQCSSSHSHGHPVLATRQAADASSHAHPGFANRQPESDVGEPDRRTMFTDLQYFGNVRRYKSVHGAVYWWGLPRKITPTVAEDVGNSLRFPSTAQQGLTPRDPSDFSADKLRESEMRYKYTP